MYDVMAAIKGLNRSQERKKNKRFLTSAEIADVRDWVKRENEGLNHGNPR